MIVSKELNNKQIAEFTYNMGNAVNKISKFEAKTNIGVGIDSDVDSDYVFRINASIISKEDESFIIECVGYYSYSLTFSDDDHTITEDFYKDLGNDYLSWIDTLLEAMCQKRLGFSID